MLGCQVNKCVLVLRNTNFHCHFLCPNQNSQGVKLVVALLPSRICLMKVFAFMETMQLCLIMYVGCSANACEADLQMWH